MEPRLEYVFLSPFERVPSPIKAPTNPNCVFLKRVSPVRHDQINPNKYTSSSKKIELKTRL